VKLLSNPTTVSRSLSYLGFVAETGEIAVHQPYLMRFLISAKHANSSHVVVLGLTLHW